ncbi:MAG: alpha-ketoacid dehydrogenase subunit beta [Anaerolineae bacterium]
MKTITYSQAIYETMRAEMARDPNVILIGEDVGTFGGVWGVSGDLIKLFGEDRVRDTPISETAIIGAGLGAAMMGLRPIVEIMFGDFLPVAGDQIVNQLAKARYMSGGKARVPVTVRVTTGAPGAAAAQHSQSPEGWYMNVPGLKIAVPATPADAMGLLRTAIRGEDPVLFFEHKMLYATKGEVPDDPDFAVPFGQAAVRREGGDVTVIAIGGMLPKALEAAELLAGEGISVEVVDPRTLVPLDKETIIASVRKTGRVVIVHEAHKRLGPGAEIAAMIAEEAIAYLDGPIVRVAARNVPLPYSPELEHYVLPQVSDIVEKTRDLARGRL